METWRIVTIMPSLQYKDWILADTIPEKQWEAWESHVPGLLTDVLIGVYISTWRQKEHGLLWMGHYTAQRQHEMDSEGHPLMGASTFWKQE